MDPKMSEEERVKSNLKNILYKDQKVYCCLCLESVRNCFFRLDFISLPWEADPSTLENMMRVIFNEQDLFNLTTEYICDVCQESLKQAFLFVAGVRNTSRILNDYFDQLHEQIDAVRNQVESTGIFVNTVLVIQHNRHKPDESYVRKTMSEDVKTDVTDEVAENFSEADANDDCNDNGSIENEVKSEPNVLICDICKKSFQYKSSLTYHLTNMHREKKGKSRPITASDSKTKPNSKITKSPNACPECPTMPCVHEKYLVSAKKEGKEIYKCKVLPLSV